MFDEFQYIRIRVFMMLILFQFLCEHLSCNLIFDLCFDFLYFIVFVCLYLFDVLLNVK